MPEVEKGIPCPFKNHPRTYIKKKSLWHDFLRELKPNESFLVFKRECQNVTHIARQVQVLLVLRHGPDEKSKVPAGQARIWRVPDAQSGQEAPAAPKAKRPYHRRQPGEPKRQYRHKAAPAAPAALNLL